MKRTSCAVCNKPYPGLVEDYVQVSICSSECQWEYTRMRKGRSLFDEILVQGRL